MINNKTFRNALHIIIGFAIMFLIAYLSDFYTYTDEAKIFGIPLLSIIITAFIGYIWEWYQLHTNKIEKIGWDDVLRTAIGGLLGGMLGTFLMY